VLYAFAFTFDPPPILSKFVAQIVGFRIVYPLQNKLSIRSNADDLIKTVNFVCEIAVTVTC